MRKFYIFALVATMFAACATDGVNELSATIEDLAPETLTVSFEGEESRIQLQEGKTVWNEGDLVSVFYRSNANQKWQFQGVTGDRTGNLKRVEMGTATETMNRVVVVYPYAESYYINPETYNVEASLPATQTYIADSYGVGGNIMVSNGEYNQVVLKSVCGWLKLELTGNGESIKSITLTGNNGEQVAGQLYINSADATATLASEMGGAEDNGSAGGNLLFEDTILTEVTLNCGDGVTLSAEPTAFYVALPPQTFTNGISLNVTATNGTTMTKTTENEIVIARNHILPMEAFEFDGVREQPNNEIWYTATQKVEPYDKTVFGATYQSNEWDSETGEGVITFDGELTEIGDYAFQYCSSLTSVTIPDSVTTIGHYAFHYCSSLTSITIPNSVTTIGNSAFKYCSSLAEFKGKFAADGGRCLIKDNTLIAYAEASGTTYKIPDSVTTIGVGAFAFCESLSSVTIPDSVTTIGNAAFYYCSRLTEFKGKFAADGGRCLIKDNTLIAYANASGLTYTIPDSVTTIGEWAFADCRILTSVTIPDSVTTIGDSAFYWCTSITSVYCEATTPPTLGNMVFYKIPSGRKIYVTAESVEEYKAATNWSEYAADIVGYNFETGEVVAISSKLFYTATAKVEPYNTSAFNVAITSNEWDEATGEGVITFDGELTMIGQSAFQDCNSLTSVTIGDSVTAIGDYAFAYCHSLTSVTIPDSVTTIGDEAFSGCQSLTSVTIPDSVTTIRDYAFYDCRSLTSVYCKATTPPTLGGSYVFDSNASGRKIYVPTESVEDYQSAENWSEYAADIVGYDFE